MWKLEHDDYANLYLSRWLVSNEELVELDTTRITTAADHVLYGNHYDIAWSEAHGGYIVAWSGKRDQGTGIYYRILKPEELDE